MDIFVTLPTCRVWIDVSIINPLAPSYLRHKDPKSSREKAKTANWGVHAEQRGLEFIPFLVDVYGGIGEQAKKWLGELARVATRRNMVDIISRDITPDTWQGQFRWELVSQIGAALAHANYCMVEEAAIKSEWPRAQTRGLFAPVWKRAPRGKVKSGDPRGRQVRRELFVGDHEG